MRFVVGWLLKWRQVLFVRLFELGYVVWLRVIVDVCVCVCVYLRERVFVRACSSVSVLAYSCVCPSVDNVLAYLSLIISLSS